MEVTEAAANRCALLSQNVNGYVGHQKVSHAFLVASQATHELYAGSQSPK